MAPSSYHIVWHCTCIYTLHHVGVHICTYKHTHMHTPYPCRGLLLNFKREFSFEDILSLWEVNCVCYYVSGKFLRASIFMDQQSDIHFCAFSGLAISW